MRRSEAAGVFGGIPRSQVCEPGKEEGRNQTMQGLESQTENVRLCAEVIGAKSVK